MGQFFETAETFIADHGFAKYVEEYGAELNDRLWSDAHKDAFGFRPREAWHYPDPSQIEEATNVLYRIIEVRISNDRKVTLMNQYTLERIIARLMHGENCGYRDALLQIAEQHHCNHGNGKIDEGQFCYALNIDYGLEPMLRHIVRGEIA